MRQISPTALSVLATNFGTEPINIVQIQWTEDGPRSSYADRDIGEIKGRITDISGLDFIINVNEGSDSAEISLTLSDVDGDLKQILDTVDIHKKDVWVYQWFEGMAQSEKFLIFQGEINSPIVWNEGDRTLKFTVISKIEDAEIGFSIEEGQFDNPPQELIGVAWPLKFGTTINVPALRFTTPKKGTLSTGVGIRDCSLDFRLQAAQKILCPLVFRGFSARYGGTLGLSLIIEPNYTEDQSCAISRCELVNNLKTQIQEQSVYEFSTIIIIDGEKFPQGVNLTLDINGGKFTGYFTGTTLTPSNNFKILSRRHPDADTVCSDLNDGAINALLDAKAVTAFNTCPGTPDPSVQTTDQSRLNVEEAQRSTDFYNAIPTSNFFWAEPGATVTIDTGEPIVYCTNLLPETVLNVSAYRNFQSGRKLVTVPQEYYTVRFSDFQSYLTTEVVLDEPLSRIADGWEDDLYITSTSTVGPNTVDIMIWLIEKYTTFTWDATTFNSVKTKLANYPSSFPILERKNILTVLQEIAYQCRCAIYLRDHKFYLIYLPDRPDAVTSISEDDVDSNTLELTHTNTEDLVTKLTATWKKDYSIEESNKIILRHNVAKYGTQEATTDWYIYNVLDLVHKSATFWLIRKSNTWRIANFNTPINKLQLETFDGVDLELPDFSPSTIRGLIQSANFDSNTRTISFQVWTPVKSGTLVEYDFAWPAAIDQTLVWPTDPERNANLIGSGTAPGFSVAPPSNHPLDEASGIQGFSSGPCASQGLTTRSFVNQTCGGGNGDTYPSDEGDTFPELDLLNQLPPDNPVDPGRINIGEGLIPGVEGVKSNSQQTNNQQFSCPGCGSGGNGNTSPDTNGGGAGSGSGDDGPSFNDLPDPTKNPNGPAANQRCEVRIFVKQALNVFKSGQVGGQPKGFVGNALTVRTDTVYVGSYCEAKALVKAVEDQHQSRQDSESYERFEVAPMGAATPSLPICGKTYTCDDMQRDSSGNAIGIRPTPTGFHKDMGTAVTSDPASTVTQDSVNKGSPSDYIGTLSPDPSGCIPSGGCPPVPVA